MKNLPHTKDSRIISSWDGGEDAAVWVIDDDRLGILTTDFITPVTDDPYTWGQIAAANSLSDVFAMGGRPIVALNIVCFPVESLGLSVLEQVLQGGLERTISAGAFLAGGHSVQDKEPKYGLAVYGEVMRNNLWRTSGAKEGDKIILTKPLGTGIAITAIKAGMIENEQTKNEAINNMIKLNSLPAVLKNELHSCIHSATDVTGFGLAGHLTDMLGENLSCELYMKSIPFIAGVKELADMGLIPEGAYRNREAYEKNIFLSGNFERSDIDLLFDPQTSGGLLLSVASESAEEVLKVIRKNNFGEAAIVGKFLAQSSKWKIILR